MPWKLGPFTEPMKRLLADLLAGHRIRVYYNEARARYELVNDQRPGLGARALGYTMRTADSLGWRNLAYKQRFKGQVEGQWSLTVLGQMVARRFAAGEIIGCMEDLN